MNKEKTLIEFEHERKCKAVLERAVDMILKYGPDEVENALVALETANQIVKASREWDCQLTP